MNQDKTADTRVTETTQIEAAFGKISPYFAQLSDQVLFGQVWQRAELSKRDRSLITVAVLTALYRHQQQPYHLVKALDNGLTMEELTEAMTHIAFYAGWPCAATGLEQLKNIQTEHSI